MTTSVIEDLENEDTSFSKRYSETTSHLETVSNWVRDIMWKCQEARSTEGSNTWDQNQMKTDFFIEIETTKKAISDKRFEEMLSTPPTGWILMGMTKSRKDGVIKAQYIKEDNYSVTPIEVINERYRWLVLDTTEKVAKMIASKEQQVEDKASTLSQEKGSRLDTAVHCIKQWRQEIPVLNFIKDMFSKLGKDNQPYPVASSLTAEREYLFSTTWKWDLQNLFRQVCDAGTLSRYVFGDCGLFDPNSDLSELVHWREGDEIPYSHIYSL